MLIGKTFGHLGQSCFLKENYSIDDGMPPEINLLNEKNNGECLLKLINENLMGSVDIKNCPWIDIDTPEALTFINENPKKFTE